MARPSADDRLRRLLALVPWVAAREGVSVAEVCSRFGLTEAELMADLDLLWMCGLPPYTPDTLIEVDIDEGEVSIRYAEYFRRPLRLTPAEGLALLAAGSAMLTVPSTTGPGPGPGPGSGSGGGRGQGPGDPDGPLARSLAKLAAVLGVGTDDALDVELGPAATEVLTTLQTATSAHRQVEIEYYSFGRDASSVRTVEPLTVFSSGGQWYVSAHDRQVGERRLFRVDRVRRVRMLDRTFKPPRRVPAPVVYQPRTDDPLVTLELAPNARWVAEQYPNEGVDDLGEGRLRVRLRVSQRPWLERLLLRLGGDAAVVSTDAKGWLDGGLDGGPDEPSGSSSGVGPALACRAAERVLRRYRDDQPLP